MNKITLRSYLNVWADIEGHGEVHLFSDPPRLFLKYSGETLVIKLPESEDPGALLDTITANEIQELIPC